MASSATGVSDADVDVEVLSVYELKSVSSFLQALKTLTAKATVIALRKNSFFIVL